MDEWLELETRAEPEAVESVSSVFAEYGQGVAIEQVVESSRDGDMVHLPPDAPVLIKTYLPVVDPSTNARRAKIEQAVWALGQLRDVGPLQVRTLRETDWANAWKEYFFVHRVGRRTVIVPSWREADYVPQPNDVVLLLDPGMAFGTGLHPTTQGCLRALSRIDVAGKRVADVGTGSAILAIACAKRGAREVLALDNDAVAVKEAKENVERNAVSIEARAGSAADLEGGYDLILANIVAAVLQKLAPELAAHLSPGGTLIVAGIIAAEEAETVGAFAAQGLTAIDREQVGDWVALQLTA